MTALETLDRTLDRLSEIKRILRPGGVLGVACVEYGGVILSGPSQELLRRFYAIRERVWLLENTAIPIAVVGSAAYWSVHASSA